MTIRTEEFIVANTARNAILAGYAVRVNDGEVCYKPTRDMESIMRNATATEETTLVIVDTKQDNKVVAAIYFVFGNGVDVLTDCTDNALTNSLLCSAENLTNRGVDAGWLA